MSGIMDNLKNELNNAIKFQNYENSWRKIGLINNGRDRKYMTAETFCFKLNANGISLKKKQLWSMEPANATGTIIYLRSHLNKYLSVDTLGNVLCENDDRNSASRFQIIISDNGCWALKNEMRGNFLGAMPDKLVCTARVPSSSELWTVHLDSRAHVNLWSIGRKRYAHICESFNEIHVDMNIPWGEDTLFTLEFRAQDHGRYAIRTFNSKYLNANGKLDIVCNEDCLFFAEYHGGNLAFRNQQGQYLSLVGSNYVLKSRSTRVTRDQLFSLVDSVPQVAFVASLNGRYVSVKQGIDVTANQEEVGENETFLLGYDSSSDRWAVRTKQDLYWCLSASATGSIQATFNPTCISDTLFKLIWHNDGSLSLRANNGKYLATKHSGHLFATSDHIKDNTKFYFYLTNRTNLILKGEHGFVGHRITGRKLKIECNRAKYETIVVEKLEKGLVNLKTNSGQYWCIDDDGNISVDANTPSEGFYLELRGPTCLCIKSQSGKYLAATTSGAFELLNNAMDTAATKWEF